MDILTFISSLVQSLAWPVAVVLIVFIFRQSLAKLIPGLRRLKYKDIEAEFGHQIEEAKQELGPPAPPPALPGPQKEGEAQRKGNLLYYRSLAEVSPRAAILEAWIEFEVAANNAVESLQLAFRKRPLPMQHVFGVLGEAGLLLPQEIDALTRLRALRNQVVHGPEPDLPPDVIAEYAILLARITEDLQSRINRERGSAEHHSEVR
jgi:hypothetical protein